MTKFIRSVAAGALLLALCAAHPSSSSAQTSMTFPQLSPKASVSQTIGVSDVAVSYHRPGVKGRVIWGGLLKYGKVWRAGANENTTITFSDAVSVEGKDLPAGTYGLHMIPTENDWTVIFSRNHTSWGSFFYKESEDALRVTVKPQSAEMQEWLVYQFDDLTNTSATLSLRWEKLRIPIKLSFDTDAIILAKFRTVGFRGSDGFSWQVFNQAAGYCLRRGINLDEALKWANTSIAYNENYMNTSTKAAILDKLGKKDEAEKVRDHAESLAASEQEVNALGYQYLSANKTREALALFKKNAKLHPNSSNVYDSLGEAYAKTGDMNLAKENYTKALSLAQDDDARDRISEELQKLQGK